MSPDLTQRVGLRPDGTETGQWAMFYSGIPSPRGRALGLERKARAGRGAAALCCEGPAHRTWAPARRLPEVPERLHSVEETESNNDDNNSIVALS